MPKSTLQLRRQLSAIEPSEQTYAGLGPSDVPSLEKTLDDREPWMAARAIYALARIDSSNARAALTKASARRRPEVRVALAAVAGDLPATTSNAILLKLLGDTDVGVRKFAIRSVSERNSTDVHSRLRDKAETETEPHLRELARERARALGM